MTRGHAADAALTEDALTGQPAPQRRARPGRHLRPVERPAPRRSPAVPVLVGAGMVLSALFGLAVMHALLIGGQIQLDKMQREVAAESEEVRRLRLAVAQLESPDRVLEVARDRLGMVPAGEVGYLLPAGIDTGDDTPIRVAAAEQPGPDDPAFFGTVSPDRPVNGDGSADDASDDTDTDTDTDPGTDTDTDTDTGTGTETDTGTDIEATSGGSEGGPEEGTE